MNPQDSKGTMSEGWGWHLAAREGNSHCTACWARVVSVWGGRGLRTQALEAVSVRPPALSEILTHVHVRGMFRTLGRGMQALQTLH